MYSNCVCLALRLKETVPNIPRHDPNIIVAKYPDSSSCVCQSAEVEFIVVLLIGCVTVAMTGIGVSLLSGHHVK